MRMGNKYNFTKERKYFVIDGQKVKLSTCLRKIIRHNALTTFEFANRMQVDLRVAERMLKEMEMALMLKRELYVSITTLKQFCERDTPINADDIQLFKEEIQHMEKKHMRAAKAWTVNKDYVKYTPALRVVKLINGIVL